MFPPQNGFTSSERASALTAVIGVDVHILMPEVGSEQRIAAGTGTQHDVDGQIALLEGLFEQGVEIQIGGLPDVYKRQAYLRSMEAGTAGFGGPCCPCPSG